MVGHNYFNAAPYINSPITGAPPSLQNVEERVPFSPGISSAQSRVLGNFFRSEYHSLQLRIERRMSRGFSFSGSYALSKNMTNHHQNRDHMITRYVEIDAFVPLNEVPRGIYGDASRGLIYGPGDVTTDLAVMRYFTLLSDVRLQVRGEFFNFNQANFNTPNTQLSSSTFGRITGAGPGRVIQLAAKLIW